MGRAPAVARSLNARYPISSLREIVEQANYCRSKAGSFSGEPVFKRLFIERKIGEEFAPNKSCHPPQTGYVLLIGTRKKFKGVDADLLSLQRKHFILCLQQPILDRSQFLAQYCQ